MAYPLIEAYERTKARLERAGKTKNESAIRKAFLRLVEGYGERRDLVLVDELPVSKQARPDATLRTVVGLDIGWVENKDRFDDLEKVVKEKFKIGYPSSNIIFENGAEIIFYQNNARVRKAIIEDSEALNAIIQSFTSFERPEEKQLQIAIADFKSNVPDMISHLRKSVESEYKNNLEFRKSCASFLINIKAAINPALTEADVAEMLIQHILTADIFMGVFSETEIHHENSIAKQLNSIESTFFRKKLKDDTLSKVHESYETIRMCASAIHDHSQKQDFLKVLYEEFYKAYNPKKADKQGIVYTPTPVVKFMVESCDFLLHENFGRTIASKNVNVLDPCTGTGVFITQIVKHLEGNVKNLKYKFQNELYCNEVDLLPYYVANLNIEYIFKQISGTYEEFQNLCLVDTLDNIFDKSHDLFTFAGISADNLERVKRQNEKRISIVIGNPPYNAHQKNVNEQNKNREYKDIDKEIKSKYLAPGVQKFKYDMYLRFICWASRRIDKDGIVAFITNNSFINARSLGGMRASLLQGCSTLSTECHRQH